MMNLRVRDAAALALVCSGCSAADEESNAGMAEPSFADGSTSAGLSHGIGSRSARSGSSPEREEPADAVAPLQPNGAAPRLGPDGFIDLAPPPGAPFVAEEAIILKPPAPPGWRYFSVRGTSCRDGSEAGLFIRFTGSKRLLIYFEGAGACTTAGFCNFNPQSVDQVLSGTGETVLGSIPGAVLGRQQPGVYNNGAVTGIFSTERSENPFRDWNAVYIPYCTGDVHFGTRDDAPVPGVRRPQRLVGYFNAQIFVGRLVPTFQAGLERVVVAGSSAGSFGAALNFSMISDAFAGVQTDVILDSGTPLEDEHWPPCLQRSWRDLFGLDAGLPPDCVECFNGDGGGLLGLADFLLGKHPRSHIALVSSLHDEVMRLFFTPGLHDCASVRTADPVTITLGQLFGARIFPAEGYEAGLLGMRERYEGTGQFASYLLSQPDDITLHQHLWRPRFFEIPPGSISIADFIRDFLDGQMDQVGP